MKRFEDWEARLYRISTERRRAAFEWGRHDCAMFAADCIQAMTGVDLASECRGRYTTKHEASGLLLDLVGGGLEEYAALVAERNGMKEVGIRYAQRGDMVLSHQPAGPSIGIVSLDGMVALFAAESAVGLMRVPVLECARAWRVG